MGGGVGEWWRMRQEGSPRRARPQRTRRPLLPASEREEEPPVADDLIGFSLYEGLRL
jgi:hypothetical protein